jgi:tetratricopeptide (TPR) repeat protein
MSSASQFLGFVSRTTSPAASACVLMFLFAICTPCQGQDMITLRKILELPIHDHITIDSKTVIDHCSKVIEKRDQHSKEVVGRALLARGNAYGRINKFEAAIQDFDEYCKIQPENAKVLIMRAIAYSSINQSEKSDKDIEKALRLDPKYPEALLGLATILSRLGDEQESLKAVDFVISLHPKHGQAYFLRGVISKTLNPIESLNSMNKFLELSPYNMMREEPYYYRGFALAQLNRTEEALSSYLMARKLNPSSYQVTQELAFTYAQLGKFNLAAHYGEECVKMDPKAPAGYYLCSVNFDRIGKRQESLLAAEKFFAHAKEDPSLYFEKAELFSLMGKYASAMEYYGKIIDGGRETFYSRVGKASLLATCPDPKIRNGAQALKLAKEAYDGKNTQKWQRWAAFVAISEAYAELGNFEEAVSNAKNAVEAAGPDFGRREELLARVTLFENKEPYRMKAAK